ncbi:MAG: aminoglycoside phosphotransferase family protein [Propionibacteriaceae bacterium]|jgi:hypothetical protein|nr:aminoglycoside phosphotransferase family protein [Propionibacteriaceae bacterium]
MLENGELVEWVRKVAGSHDPRVTASTPVYPMRTPDVLTRPVHPRATRVYLCGGVAVRVHAEGTRGIDLARRLDAIETPDLDNHWLHPLSRGLLRAPGGLYGTMWPRATLVSTIEAAPWLDAGRLLGRLHTARIVPDLPRHGGVVRFRQALERAGAEPELRWLADVGERLRPQLAATSRRALVHGHWHLGHLGHPLLSKRWRLLDPDDLGLGDPLWDLGLPAGYRLAGLFDDDAWDDFTTGYRQAGGDFDAERLRPFAQGALLLAAVNELTSPLGGKATTIVETVRALDRGDVVAGL